MQFTLKSSPAQWIVCTEEPVYHSETSLLYQDHVRKDSYGQLSSHHPQTIDLTPKIGAISSRRFSIDSCATRVETELSLDFESGKVFHYYEPLTWRKYFLQEVSLDVFLEFELHLLTFCTGIIDAATFSNYRLFCSKQTGNTVALALMAFGSSDMEHNEQSVVLSFGGFISSALLFGWAGNLIGPRRRLWLLLNSFISTILMISATVLIYHEDIETKGHCTMAVIGLLALVCGAQLQLALSIRMPELNTTMITVAITSLVSDPKLLSRRNPVRDRRALYWVSILVGALVGALASRLGGPMFAISLAAAVKISVGFLFLFNSAE
ncbi:MAG: hypothetical protein MMC33_003135 [Icmadophila ericetorum]|nr:hypothetical protein [Icmadophila ericetorum]